MRGEANAPPGPLSSSDAPQRAPGARTRVPVLAAVAGMVAGGLAVAAFTVDPPPAPIALTIDSFPREVFGELRADVSFRDAGSKAVLDRLDTQFDDQISAHRFAYGGDGATFRYGPHRTLTIVNGRLAPAVPLAGGRDDWEVPTAVSLQAGLTSCVTDLPREADEMEEEVFVDPSTGAIESIENDRPWTDCVLVDTDRNLSLRLSGIAPVDAESTTTAASRYRDELERIHAHLTR